MSGRAGELRHTIVIQQEARTPDGQGGFTIVWNTFATVYGGFEPLSGVESVVARQLQDATTHRLTIRYLSGVKAGMRVLYNSRLFNIRDVLNLDERNRWMELRVEEGVAT